MSVRGIRGAITVSANTQEAVVAATQEILAELVQLNHLDTEEIAAAHFTVTKDIDAEFPAYGARRMGWVDVPMICSLDLDVSPPNPRGVPMCIRVLLLYNTDLPQRAIRHAYLGGAQSLRADLEQTLAPASQEVQA